MGRWRQKLARKRVSGGGAAFVGIFVAALFVGLGVVCLVMEAIPVHARWGTSTWLAGPQKNCFGTCFLCVAAALHFGFVWTKVESLRWAGFAGMLVAMAAAGLFFFATLA